MIVNRMTHSIYLKPIEPTSENRKPVVTLFKKLREQTDARIVPEYWPTFTDAFFEAVWDDYFRNPQNYRARVLHDQSSGKDMGLLRVGIVDPFFNNYLDQSLPQKTAELHQIYLDNEFIGQGLGRRLYRQACMDICKLGYRHMFMSTYFKNDRAKEFYVYMGADHLKDTSVSVTLDGITTLYKVSFFLHSNLG